MTSHEARTKCFAILVAIVVTAPALAHDQDLRSGTIKPTVGIMSEAVVRQKLTTYGVRDVTQLIRKGDEYRIKATYEGRPVDLTMTARTGLLTNMSTRSRLLPAADVTNKMIRSQQLRIERPALVRPGIVQPEH
jgi:hypothetical protein